MAWGLNMKVPKLIAIEEFGEGYIKLPKEWNDYDPLLKSDLLKDWLYALESQYKASLIEMDAQSIIRRAIYKNEQDS